MNRFIPKKTFKSCQRPTLTLQHNLNRLHTLRRKHSKKPSPGSKNKLSAAEHKFQELASATKYEYENCLIHRLLADKNYSINNYISSFTKHNTLPSSIFYEGNCTISNSDKANLFNQCFSIFTRDFQHLRPTHLLIVLTSWKIYHTRSI